MNSVPKINASLSYEYNNALHAQFNDRMHGIVGKIDATLINLPTQMYTNWRTFINLEIDINAEIAANAETKEMNETDVIRDGQVVYLFEDIRNQCRSPFPEKKDAANKLVLYVDAFNGVQKEANDVETARLKSLISDLRNETNAPLCSILGLDELINLLETTNNKYETLKATRTTSRTDSKLPKSIEVRKQTDDVYNKVCKIIEVAYLISDSDDDKKTILALISEMNQYIGETKTSYNQMQAAIATEKKKEQETTEQ